jgi:hypothetical protein
MIGVTDAGWTSLRTAGFSARPAREPRGRRSSAEAAAIEGQLISGAPLESAVSNAIESSFVGLT